MLKDSVPRGLMYAPGDGLRGQANIAPAQSVFLGGRFA